MCTARGIIRPVRFDDMVDLEDLLEDLCNVADGQCFLATSHRSPDSYVASLADPQRTLFARVATGESGGVVALGALHPMTSTTAEFGLVVDEHETDDTVGAQVLRVLLGKAQELGIEMLVALVHPTNQRILHAIVEDVPGSCFDEQGRLTIEVPTTGDRAQVTADAGGGATRP